MCTEYELVHFEHTPFSTKGRQNGFKIAKPPTPPTSAAATVGATPTPPIARPCKTANRPAGTASPIPAIHPAATPPATGPATPNPQCPESRRDSYSSAQRAQHCTRTDRRCDTRGRNVQVFLSPHAYKPCRNQNTNQQFNMNKRFLWSVLAKRRRSARLRCLVAFVL
jgi:hypothetical protein